MGRRNKFYRKNMASCLRAKPSNAFCLCRFYSSSRAYGRIWEDGNNQKWYQSSKRLTFLASGFGLVGGTALWLAYRKQERNDSGLVPFVQAASPSTYDMKRQETTIGTLSAPLSRLSSRERRFVQFASTEYGGQLYMTPQDFLESVIEAEPRPRLKRRIIQRENLVAVQNTTPPLTSGSSRTFRDLRDQGIISYTEYLFLLSILTKPKSGFRIAFNMFDTDGNARVDKNEFLVLLGILCQKVYKEDLMKGIDPAQLEKIFSHAYRDRRGLLRSRTTTEKNGPVDCEVATIQNQTEKSKIRDNPNSLDEGLQRRHEIDTTLLVHLFGKSGSQELTYEQFSTFMENLQTEVLELEFLEFSKGLSTITELDFAKILLRYTQLNPEAYVSYPIYLLCEKAKFDCSNLKTPDTTNIFIVYFKAMPKKKELPSRNFAPFVFSSTT